MRTREFHSRYPSKSRRTISSADVATIEHALNHNFRISCRTSHRIGYIDAFRYARFYKLIYLTTCDSSIAFVIARIKQSIGIGDRVSEKGYASQKIDSSAERERNWGTFNARIRSHRYERLKKTLRCKDTSYVYFVKYLYFAASH